MGSYADELLSPQAQTPSAGYGNELLNPPTDQKMGPGRAIPEYVRDDPAYMPSMGQIAAGSLPTDDMTRARYYASRIFPDVPVDKALDNFFYKNGRLAYIGEDGSASYAEPSFGLPGNGWAKDMASNAKALAAQAGPGMETVPATGAGILTSEFGGGIPGAGIVGTLMNGARQALSSLITDDKTPFSVGQAVGAGGREMVGQAIGLGFAKGMGSLGKTPAFNIPETTDLGQKAAAVGLPDVLTAGEQTGNRQLIRRQKILHNTTDADQIFEDFYKLRNDKVGTAVYNILDTISKAPSVREGAGSGVSGALEAVALARKDLQAQAKPFYDEALAPDNLIEQRFLGGSDPLPKIGDSGLQYLDIPRKFDPTEPLNQTEAGVLRYAQNAARKDPVLGEVLKNYPDNSMYALDATKKYLDDMIGGAKKDGEKFKASVLTNTREKLLNIMDTAQPSYAKARGIYEEGMPGVSQVERGVVGDAAKLEANDVTKAPQIIFGNNSSPQDVRIARNAFEKAGQMDAWNDLTRSWLQQSFENIKDSANGGVVNVGGTFRKSIYSSPKQREILQAAFEHTPDTLKSLNWMMDVLDATGKAMKGESITAFAQMGQKELANEAKGFGPKVLETIEIWKTPSRLANWWADVQTGKYAEQQARLLTSPEGLTRLKELRKLSPGSTAAITSLSHLLTTSGAESARGAIAAPKDGFLNEPGYQQ